MKRRNVGSIRGESLTRPNDPTIELPEGSESPGLP